MIEALRSLVVGILTPITGLAEWLLEDKRDRELAEILQDLEDLRPWTDGTG